MADTPSVVAAIDQGTTSTRCMLFDAEAKVVAIEQVEHDQHLPQRGWVEHDAVQIWANTRTVMDGALAAAECASGDVAAIGITNQRETTVVWDRRSGHPVGPAIVWQDTRTQAICDRLGDPDRYRARTGLPLATYFAGPKIRWILDNIAASSDLAFGTIDSWLLWNMTGGRVHATDATNASRTLLMDLDTLAWVPEIADELGVPLGMLPEIRTSSEVYGTMADGPLAGVPIAGILGDQQAATFGQACLEPGEAKNTYGTGNFLLLNTGTEKVLSKNGLLTTVCYQFGSNKPIYALEGSIAVTGSAVQWLRDQLGIISGAAETESLARQVSDNGGMYFVPAFSGLFAPYWRSDARGAIVGLSRFNTNAHLARATLEAICYQSRDVAEAMEADSGVRLEVLKVDGGVTANDLCMQLQADILGVPVSRPVVAETTALGAAYAAGLATGFWSTTSELRANWNESKRWTPSWTEDERATGYVGWKKAVQRTLDWVDVS
jgi:glycerol kinase